MPKRTGYVATRSVWPQLVILGVMAASGLLALPSMLFPYIASANYKWFCHFILAPATFLILYASFIISVHKNRNAKYVKNISIGNLLFRGAFASAAFSALWAWLLMLIIPAIPSKYLAEKAENISAVVNHFDGFRLDYDYYTWIYFDRDGHEERFMWTRADRIMQKLKRGDCIVIHAREWPLGVYVDSIGRSHACGGARVFGASSIEGEARD